MIKDFFRNRKRTPSVLLIIIAFAAGFWTKNAFATDYDALRERMVQTQILKRGIQNPRVIDAMRKVERHLFVPRAARASAYGDFPLAIGEGQTISQPYIVALMTELLELKPDDKALEIGTGSGYQAAVLAESCRSVYTIEIVPVLGERSRKLLAELGYENAFVKIGDGYMGWPEHSPFDAIIVTCSPGSIPRPLVDQLAEGGRMVIPVGERFTQELVLLRKEDGAIIKEAIIPVRFVPMVGPDGKRY